MSAQEVIEQIKNLPPEEQVKVTEFVRAQQGSQVTSQKVNDDFKRVADHVFTNNEELFRKLAK